MLEMRKMNKLYNRAWRHAPAVGTMRFRRHQRSLRLIRHYQRVSRHFEAVTAALGDLR